MSRELAPFSVTRDMQQSWAHNFFTCCTPLKGRFCNTGNFKYNESPEDKFIAKILWDTSAWQFWCRFQKFGWKNLYLIMEKSNLFVWGKASNVNAHFFHGQCASHNIFTFGTPLKGKYLLQWQFQIKFVPLKMTS